MGTSIRISSEMSLKYVPFKIAMIGKKQSACRFKVERWQPFKYVFIRILTFKSVRNIVNSKSPPVWRIIDTGPLSGAENMAIDEALLRSFDPASSQPVLRLYGWEPPALSLGRFQKAAEVLDLERCRIDAVPVVRRITGGGVIYHADELTYSIICSPAQLPPATSIKDSFRELTAFLLAFYRRLGLQAEYAVDAITDSTRLGEKTDFCFAGRETFDILVNGRKIGGNAQRRLKEVVFQHGSIPIVNRAGIGLGYMRDQLAEYAAETSSLMECGIAADRNSLCQELRSAFKDVFSVELLEDACTAGEQESADSLVRSKYSCESWNLHGVEA
jgi:lipoate-protein ligase A